MEKVSQGRKREGKVKRARKNRFNDNNPLTVHWFY